MARLNEHEEADLEVYMSELQRLTDEEVGLRMVLSFDIICGLVANIQLALRHPHNNGDGAACGRAWCDVMISEIEKVSPKLARIVRKGWLFVEDA